MPTDLFEYDNDPDDDTLYRVTYKKDGMVFTDQTLAVALSDALAHHTDQSRPAQPPKRRGMRKPGNGPQTIEHERTVEETLPSAPESPKADVESQAGFPDSADLAKGAERKPAAPSTSPLPRRRT